MKLTNIVFCLTLLAGAATSCIREDLDDCLSTNTLLLSYKGDGTTEIFPDKICRVEMFVFDAENRCVNSSILPEEQVKDRTATLPARCRRLPDCLPGEHPPHEGRWHRHGRFRPDALCRRGLFRRETGCRQRFTLLCYDLLYRTALQR